MVASARGIGLLLGTESMFRGLCCDVDVGTSGPAPPGHDSRPATLSDVEHDVVGRLVGDHGLSELGLAPTDFAASARVHEGDRPGANSLRAGARGSVAGQASSDTGASFLLLSKFTTSASVPPRMAARSSSDTVSSKLYAMQSALLRKVPSAWG